MNDKLETSKSMVEVPLPTNRSGDVSTARLRALFSQRNTFHEIGIKM